MQLVNQAPILGICGRSGAGKTTLIEALLPPLNDLGLHVVVVKDGAHRVQVDLSGKDSDRFFQAGADVALFGEQHFLRKRQASDLTAFLTTLCASYDLILVEGHASTPVPKFWLSGPQQDPVPEGCQGKILGILTREQATVAEVFVLIQKLLAEKWQQTPVWGCVLIGGQSSRMGSPKHLLQQGGKTWLEWAVKKLQPKVETVVLSGSGLLPESLRDLNRVPDAPGLAGPLAGILALMRWHPRVSWLVTACDLPDVQPESLDWLLAQRQVGMRALLPRLGPERPLEPLLAWYDFRCLPLLENLAASGSLRLSRLAEQQGVCIREVPRHLHASWRNVNHPEELLHPNQAPNHRPGQNGSRPPPK
jgi:molybdopterin-guanine dinucleotide biosynthesis protein MobB